MNELIYDNMNDIDNTNITLASNTISGMSGISSMGLYGIGMSHTSYFMVIEAKNLRTECTNSFDNKWGDGELDFSLSLFSHMSNIIVNGVIYSRLTESMKASLTKTMNLESIHGHLRGGSARGPFVYYSQCGLGNVVFPAVDYFVSGPSMGTKVEEMDSMGRLVAFPYLIINIVKDCDCGLSRVQDYVNMWNRIKLNLFILFFYYSRGIIQ